MSEDKKKLLKEIIEQLHAGVPPKEVKEKFRNMLENVSSAEIAKIEQELVKEGLPRKEIQRVCDVHLEVFREQLGKQKLDIPTGHPINILMEEHKIMLQNAEKLHSIAGKLQKISDKKYIGNEIHSLGHLAEDFRGSEKHYLREENVLFPLLEKHGITEPPAIMWIEHNQIREKKKQLSKLVEDYNSTDFQSFKEQLAETAEALSNLLPNHFFKENNILFPITLGVVTEEEWKEASKEFNEIGFCCFTPPLSTTARKMEVKEEAVAASEGLLRFETGTLSKEELEATLDSLPIDITFVDKNDVVKYFSKLKREFSLEQNRLLEEKCNFVIRKKAYT